MKTLLAGLAAFITTLPALAALAPYYDSVEQYKAILANDDVADAVGSAHRIVELSARGHLTYTIETSNYCDFDVELEAMVPNHPGPTTYHVKHVGHSVCK